MKAFSTAKEKGSFQHLSNYFHSERSEAEAWLYFGCVCFGLLLMAGAGITPDS